MCNRLLRRLLLIAATAVIAISAQRYITPSPHFRYDGAGVYHDEIPDDNDGPSAQIVSNSIVNPRSSLRNGASGPSAAAYRRTVLRTVKYRRPLISPTDPILNRPLPIVAVSNTQQMYWRPDCCAPEPMPTPGRQRIATRKIQLHRTSTPATVTTMSTTTTTASFKGPEEDTTIPKICQRTVNVLTGGDIHAAIESLFTHDLHLTTAGQCAISCYEHNCDLAYFTRGKGLCQFTTDSAASSTSSTISHEMKNCTFGLAVQEIPPVADALASNILVFCIKCATNVLKRSSSVVRPQPLTQMKIMENLRLVQAKKKGTKLRDIPNSAQVDNDYVMLQPESSASYSRRYRPSSKQRLVGISRSYNWRVQRGRYRYLRRSSGWA